MATRYISAMLLMLLMASICSAWPSGYEPASCQAQSSILGSSYVTAVVGSSIACQVQSSLVTPLISNTPAIGTRVVTTGTPSMYGVTNSCTEPLCSCSGYGGCTAVATSVVVINTAVLPATSYGTLAYGNITNSSATIVGTDAMAITITKGSGNEFNISNGTNSIWFNATSFTVTIGASSSCYILCCACSASAAGYFMLNNTLLTGATENNFALSATTPALYTSYFGGYLTRSNFSSGTYNTTASGYCRALLYYSGAVVIPELSVVPGVEAWPYFFNATSGSISYLKNNSVMYVLDQITAEWYVVPAIQCIDYSTIYTVSVLHYNTASATSSTNATLIPTKSICRKVSGVYYIDYSFSLPVNYVIYYSNNTTYSNYAITNTSLGYSIAMPPYTTVNLTANGITYCYENGSSSILNMPSLSNADTSTIKPIVFIIWLGVLAVSAAMPPALIAPILLNDVFSLVDANLMGLLVALIAAVAGLSMRQGSMTIKSMVLYAAFMLTMLSIYYAHIGWAPIALLANLSNLAQVPSSGDLYQFAVNAIVLPVNVFLFVMSLPLFVADAISSALAISPALQAGYNAIKPAILMGSIIWFVLKAYEVFSNRFREL